MQNYLPNDAKRLKRRYYQSGQALLNILEKKKNKILKINNNDYIHYINDLNNHFFFEQYQN